MRINKIDTKIQSDQMVLENGAADWFSSVSVASNLHFVKTAVSAKHNKIKCNKMRSACILIMKINKEEAYVCEE